MERILKVCNMNKNFSPIFLYINELHGNSVVCWIGLTGKQQLETNNSLDLNGYVCKFQLLSLD